MGKAQKTIKNEQVNMKPSKEKPNKKENHKACVYWKINC